VGEVVWLARYPVKSMLGERLQAVDITESGVDGDRRYALIDSETGKVASAKDPRRWDGLLAMSAQQQPDGATRITLPDGRQVLAGDPATDTLLSTVVNRAVRLSDVRPDGAQLDRLTAEGEPGAGQLTQSRVAAGTPGSSFVDFAPLHLMTTNALATLAAAHPKRALDVRRFRPNLVIRMSDASPLPENDWSTISIGPSLRLRVIVPTPRCVMPTLAHGELPADPDVLRAVARRNRLEVLDLGRLSCAGVYARVTAPGRVHVGDIVQAE
jgi:MOSC domain-containing protein